MSNVLILGGSGLLGSEILKLSNDEFTFIKVERDENNFAKLVERLNPTAIVNCVASLPNADELESLEINFNYPLRRVQEIIQFDSLNVKWIQVSSYFELQIIFGREDNYSKHKSLLREKLSKMASGGTIELTSLFMPYLAGFGERSTRIVPTLLNTQRANGDIILSSGTQYLPILTSIDAAKAVYFSLKTSQLECAAIPVWYGTIKELVSLASNFTDVSRIVFDAQLKASDANYPKIEFPAIVNNWKPDITLEEYFRRSTSPLNKIV